MSQNHSKSKFAKVNQNSDLSATVSFFFFFFNSQTSAHCSTRGQFLKLFQFREILRDSERGRRTVKLSEQWMFPLSGRMRLIIEHRKCYKHKIQLLPNTQEILPNYYKCTKIFNYIYTFKI